MISQEIRRNFLRFFKEKGHAVIASSSVVPHDDPTLLFTNAGMNQFKDVFLGKNVRDYHRAATAQKCIRVGGKHNDLENVGHTTRHLTFFEMLGNFSFGDYFKKEAISFAWDMVTQVFQLDAERIWITIFKDDDEAFELWRAIVPQKRIVRLGEKDNFWAMGDTGPCGPCSELLYDRGPKFGNATSPVDDVSGERFFEFWNLVFMQFNRNSSGEMVALPKQSIDTGAGLERVVSLKMGVENLFATDVLRSLIAQIEQVSGKPYQADDRVLAPAYHVIADHVRTLAFAVADGAQPSNTDRGYVLRKILRRAVRYGKMIGFQEPFLAHILPRLVAVMGDDYPELRLAQHRIGEILTLEEEAFFRTLARGGNILQSIVESARKTQERMITGEEAFKLKDTYGLPLEEIQLIAKDSHLMVDVTAFQALEQKARDRSRNARNVQSAEAKDALYGEFVKAHKPCRFLGYETVQTESVILGIVVNNQFVPRLEAGQEGIVILDCTPFYAEKGGQVGDIGLLEAADCSFTVGDCQNPYPGVITHIGKVQSGTIAVGVFVTAAIDAERRRKIQSNHTAAHLLHWALHKILGPHIRQAGSLVTADRLRFDFNHHKPLSVAELEAVEDLINQKICANQPVIFYEIPYEKAQQDPEIKQFFGDKYGVQVRVVDIGYSKELCGGTHADRTGSIGYFRIAKESGIAAGVRRIEACSGLAAVYFERELRGQGLQKNEALAQEIKVLQGELKAMRRAMLRDMAKALVASVVQINAIPFIASVVYAASGELLPLAEEIHALLDSGVLALAICNTEKCHLLVYVTPDLVNKGIQAVELVRKAAICIEGSGGGKVDIAQAGGKKPQGIEQAFDTIRLALSTQ